MKRALYGNKFACRSCLGGVKDCLCLRRAGESKAGLEGLVLLLKYIRLIAERNAATPAERLLDDLLRLMDAPEGALDANEVQEVLLAHILPCSLFTIFKVQEVLLHVGDAWQIIPKPSHTR